MSLFGNLIVQSTPADDHRTDVRPDKKRGAESGLATTGWQEARGHGRALAAANVVCDTREGDGFALAGDIKVLLQFQ